MPDGNCEPQTWQLGPLGDFAILEHERLKDPTEMLKLLLQRFVDQKAEFQECIPPQKDLGLLRVTFAELRSTLTPRKEEPKANISPNPDHCLRKLKGILPQLVKARIAAAKKWMEEKIEELAIRPTKVEGYVK